MSEDHERKMDTSGFMKMESYVLWKKMKRQTPDREEILTLRRFEKKLEFRIDKEFLKHNPGKTDRQDCTKAAIRTAASP